MVFRLLLHYQIINNHVNHYTFKNLEKQLHKFDELFCGQFIHTYSALVTLLLLWLQPKRASQDSDVCRKFSWGGWFRVIWWSFVFGVLFVTSQFDAISMFPNQRFGEVS